MIRGVVLAVLAAGFIALLVTKEPSRPMTWTEQAPSAAAPSKPAVPPPKPKKQPTVDKSPAMQKQRQQLIQKLIGERVFTKVDTPGTSVRVHVAPRFYTLDFDMKQQFVSVVYAYAYDGSADFEIVRVMDSRTNKSVGNFTKELGLRLD